MRWIKLILISGMILIVLNSCPAGVEDSNNLKGQSQINVDISGFSFNPGVITISKGATVTWTNKDSTHHTVTSSGNFDSGELLNGNSFSRQFNDTGTFSYSCSYHPSMTGQITVE